MGKSGKEIWRKNGQRLEYMDVVVKSGQKERGYCNRRNISYVNTNRICTRRSGSQMSGTVICNLQQKID